MLHVLCFTSFFNTVYFMTNFVLLFDFFQTEPLCDDQHFGLTYRGEIIVALKFVPPGVDVVSTFRKSSGSTLRRSNSSSSKRGSLLILVKEAKNLLTPKGSGIPDPFVKW